MNKKSVFRIVITFIVVSALFIAGFFAIDAYTQKVPIMSIRQSKKIGATYMTLNNPFFEIIDEQLQNILSTEGYTLMSLDPVLDLKTQREQIEYLIDQKVDAIVVNPVDYKGLRIFGKANYYTDGEYYDFCMKMFFSNGEVTPFGATKPKGAIVVNVAKVEKLV